MELEFVQWLQQQICLFSGWTSLGPGDDAAVLKQIANEQLVVTTDSLCDEVHFNSHEDSPERIGRKAIAVNLSDIAGMACEPIAAFVSFLLPNQQAENLAKRLTQGMLPLLKEFHADLAGGDTNCWNSKLAINVAVVGKTRNGKALVRSGAEPGDAILVTGELGGSILGKHYDFVPRIREAMTLTDRYQVHSGMDISDGLLLDLSRLALASGVGAVLDLNAIPISHAARRLAQTGESSSLDHALSDGEDFELLLTTSQDCALSILQHQPLDIPIRQIGTITEQPGIWMESASGDLAPLEVKGFEHGKN